jgi:hypothetical protein
MSNRERLPDRRYTQGFSYAHEGQQYTAHIGFYDDGRVSEVFAIGAKSGTGVDIAIREATTLLSVALQYGADFDGLRKSMPRDPGGGPLGPVGAAMDIIAREMAA